MGTSTNDYGVTFFKLSCREATDADCDYYELMELLKRKFGAVEINEMVGPYSVHKYLRIERLCFGLILDSPDWLDLYANDACDVPALESLVTQVLKALNEPEQSPGIG